MHVRRLATHVEILTPAKINLFLEVLAKRPDGYHEIETLLVAVTTYDTLVFAANTKGEITLEARWAAGLAAQAASGEKDSPAARELLCGELPCSQENLVWRAAVLVRERAGLKQGASIRLVKRIPAAAGLGGASSDAAATLIAANEAWELKWSREQLAELALELGSDVPFFLTPGGAVCRGRGERIETIQSPRLHIVVARPPVGLSTPQVYKQCRTNDQPVGVTALMQALARGDSASAGRRMVNDLQAAAASLTPWITWLQSEFQKQDVLGSQMSGSGSSCFALCRSGRHARRVAARLRAGNVGAVFSTSTAVST
jgi:4-diphosphocytidyl-2-C-methyl-D-erythritol kinase